MYQQPQRTTTACGHDDGDDDDDLDQLRAQLAKNRELFGLAAPLLSQQQQRPVISAVAHQQRSATSSPGRPYRYPVRSPRARYADAFSTTHSSQPVLGGRVVGGDYYTTCGAVSAFAADDAVPRGGGYHDHHGQRHPLGPTTTAHLLPSSFPGLDGAGTTPFSSASVQTSAAPRPSTSSSSVTFTGIPVLGPIAMLRGCASEYSGDAMMQPLPSLSWSVAEAADLMAEASYRRGVPFQAAPLSSQTHSTVLTRVAEPLRSPVRPGRGLQSPRRSMSNVGGASTSPSRRGPISSQSGMLVPLISPSVSAAAGGGSGGGDPAPPGRGAPAKAVNVTEAISALRTQVAQDVAARPAELSLQRRPAASPVTPPSEERSTASGNTSAATFDVSKRPELRSAAAHPRQPAAASHSHASSLDGHRYEGNRGAAGATVPPPAAVSRRGSRGSSRRASIAVDEQGDPLHALRRQVTEFDGQEIFSDAADTRLTRGRRPTLLPTSGKRYVVSDSSGPESTGPSPATSLRTGPPVGVSSRATDASAAACAAGSRTIDVRYRDYGWSTDESQPQAAGEFREESANDDVMGYTQRPPPPPFLPTASSTDAATVREHHRAQLQPQPLRQHVVEKCIAGSGATSTVQSSRSATAHSRLSDGAGSSSHLITRPQRQSSRRPSAASSVGPAVCAFLAEDNGRSTLDASGAVAAAPPDGTAAGRAAMTWSPPSRRIVATTRNAFAFGADRLGGGAIGSGGGWPVVDRQRLPSPRAIGGGGGATGKKTSVHVVTSTQRVVTYSV